MSLIYPNRYPGRWYPTSEQYPQGKFKNRSSPTAKDGSFCEMDWANDWAGFFGAVLKAAGVTPNGNVDTAASSQVYDALGKLFPLKSTLGNASTKNVGVGAGDVAAGNVTFGISQAWRNMTSSRQYGVMYTNSSSRPIAVGIHAALTISTTLTIEVDNITVTGFNTANMTPQEGFLFAVVPPGAQYRAYLIRGNSQTILNWAEMN
ncbi:tail fiber protein [Edwardsiella phage PEi21]|uniref:Tail fiber protein n=1 Tax=Edwardsiella phage PEi21 TaxID=1325372 RepID=N0DQR7_9CAUD|nr:tail fiber protein [Edwardsiella phage PEi21]BAN16854.1 hypothetical protein [Edwardsiella phage PEi21]